jgi:predicted DNA-binding transcriptional regulator YafY
VTATVRVRGGRPERVGTVVAERADGAGVLLDLAFADRRHAEHASWALGPDVEVLAPGWLRAAVAARAAAVAALYERPADGGGEGSDAAPGEPPRR